MAPSYTIFFQTVQAIRQNPKEFEYTSINRLHSMEAARVYMYVLPKLLRLNKAACCGLLSALLPLPEDQRNVDAEYKRANKLFAALKRSANKPLMFCAKDRREFFLGPVPAAVTKSAIARNEKCDLRRGANGRYCDHKFDYTDTLNMDDGTTLIEEAEATSAMDDGTTPDDAPVPSATSIQQGPVPSASGLYVVFRLCLCSRKCNYQNMLVLNRVVGTLPVQIAQVACVHAIPWVS